MASSMVEALAKALTPDKHYTFKLQQQPSKRKRVKPVTEIRTATIIDREIEEVQQRLAALKKEREAAAVTVNVLGNIVTIAGLLPDGPIAITRAQLLMFVKSNGLAKMRDATVIKDN